MSKSKLPSNAPSAKHAPDPKLAFGSLLVLSTFVFGNITYIKTGRRSAISLSTMRKRRIFTDTTPVEISTEQLFTIGGPAPGSITAGLPARPFSELGLLTTFQIGGQGPVFVKTGKRSAVPFVIGTKMRLGKQVAACVDKIMIGGQLVAELSSTSHDDKPVVATAPVAEIEITKAPKTTNTHPSETPPEWLVAQAIQKKASPVKLKTRSKSKRG